MFVCPADERVHASASTYPEPRSTHWVDAVRDLRSRSSACPIPVEGGNPKIALFQQHDESRCLSDSPEFGSGPSASPAEEGEWHRLLLVDSVR